MKVREIYRLSLCVCVALLGCDDELEEACDCGVGLYEDAQGRPPPGEGGYRHLMITDDSVEENASGTPGVDICGVYAVCDGVRLSGRRASLSTRDQGICAVGASGCAASRGDPSAAEDDGAACVGGSTPSDYVSLGMSGTLRMEFERDLNGCVLYVVELNGVEVEDAEVSICLDHMNQASCEVLGVFSTPSEAGPRGGVEHAFEIAL